MRDARHDGNEMIWRNAPLARLLAINFGLGTALAVLLVGGLLVVNPGGLRGLILADQSPVVALGLLFFGFVVTLGSTAMGTAIMAMGVGDDDRPGGGLPVQEAIQRPKTRR
jgi:hypothetical protein